jgi:hypothetical protein
MGWEQKICSRSTWESILSQQNKVLPVCPAAESVEVVPTSHFGFAVIH